MCYKSDADKFALKTNKRAFNVENDLKKKQQKIKGLKIILMPNQFQKTGIFYTHHHHFDYKTGK